MALSIKLQAHIKIRITRSNLYNSMKTCGKCKESKDESEFYVKNKKTGQLQSYCKRCLCDTQMQRWIDRKVKAIEYKGGKCADCNTEYPREVYDFHHLDPSEKDVDWGRLRLRSWDSIVKELDKCVLLCANCHRIRHT